MTGRRLTNKGVKPIGLVQWQRENYYLYGVVEPKTGESFFYEFSHLDTICFQEFLQQLSQEYPEDLHIIQLDNGGFHLTSWLQIPTNIILLFQPSHSPEVNPIERLWKELKKYLHWQLFSSLDELRFAVRKVLHKLDRSILASLIGWNFLLDALYVAGI
jgi:transposase